MILYDSDRLRVTYHKGQYTISRLNINTWITITLEYQDWVTLRYVILGGEMLDDA